MEDNKIVKISVDSELTCFAKVDKKQLKLLDFLSVNGYLEYESIENFVTDLTKEGY